MFQSTRPMRGATALTTIINAYGMVSIHAPHAGRDRRYPYAAHRGGVSIHAPHAGRDWLA